MGSSADGRTGRTELLSIVVAFNILGLFHLPPLIGSETFLWPGLSVGWFVIISLKGEEFHFYAPIGAPVFFKAYLLNIFHLPWRKPEYKKENTILLTIFAVISFNSYENAC